MKPGILVPIDDIDSPTSSPKSSIRPLRSTMLRALLHVRVWILALGHLAVFGLIYWLAYSLRFDFSVPPSHWSVMTGTLPWLLGVKLLIFYFAGHYHGWWSYVTFADLVALFRAAILSLIVIAALDHFIIPQQIPRSVLILDFVLTVMVFGALRASWRMLQEQFWPAVARRDCRNALLVGADRAAGMLAYHIHSQTGMKYRICGFLATNGEGRGMRLGQIPVLGKLSDIEKIAERRGISEVLVTVGRIPGGQLRQLMDQCDKAGLLLKIIPPLEEVLRGGRQIPMRDIDITDLLRRSPVELDDDTIGEMLAGRRVLVTGAGGSIGSEICRQVMRFGPSELILVGRGENRLFHIDMELRESHPTSQLHVVVGDVVDEKRMRQVFEAHRPEIVFHAAAHKHVPMMERNVGQAVKNNVLGTKCVADLSDEYDVKSFVLISTDKAVNPTSVMGTTKHLAERYVNALSQESSTQFFVVRFGNVLGSAGSVVPIFKQQIRHGGPITITDPQMTRFFMTIPEASQLVLQAAAMGHGGEIFVLDMGEPVRIVDLAHDLIRLSGLPLGSIEIKYTGIRPGEKLFEELYFDEEETLPTHHPKVRAASHRMFTFAEVSGAINDLLNIADAPEASIRHKLQELVPEYQPHQPRSKPETEGQAIVSR